MCGEGGAKSWDNTTQPDTGRVCVCVCVCVFLVIYYFNISFQKHTWYFTPTKCQKYFLKAVLHSTIQTSVLGENVALQTRNKSVVNIHGMGTQGTIKVPPHTYTHTHTCTHTHTHTCTHTHTHTHTQEKLGRWCSLSPNTERCTESADRASGGTL